VAASISMLAMLVGEIRTATNAEPGSGTQEGYSYPIPVVELACAVPGRKRCGSLQRFRPVRFIDAAPPAALRHRADGLSQRKSEAEQQVSHLEGKHDPLPRTLPSWCCTTPR